jgi:fermentation-respiration switch protein FrsA (DUF1100 family)
VPVVVRPLVVVALLVVALFLLLWLTQRRLIYFPDRAAPPAAAVAIPRARDVVLETSDGLRLGAWLVPPAAPDRRVAVLVAPGNGGNRAGRAGFARSLAAHGLTVLLVDYRGYGGNPGRPTAAGLALDIRAARSYLAGAGWAPERVIYYGESLGSAVVTELAVEHPPAGLVLRSPFVDLAAAGQHHYPLLPVRLLLRDKFPVADLIGDVRAPSVVIYGTADTVIPPEQSREVAQRAGGLVEVVVVEGADHNDAALFDGPQTIGAVVALAERIADRP